MTLVDTRTPDKKRLISGSTGDWEVIIGMEVHAQVTSALRRAIVSGLLQPGEALSETVLAQRFGVSRTPVREALKQLERERLVDIVPRVGTYVRKATGDEVLDGLVVKEALEGAAARLMAARPDIGRRIHDVAHRRVVQKDTVLSDHARRPDEPGEG